MLSKMIRIAASGHSMQFDLQGEPYILHCMRVMHGLNTKDDELKMIAVGHDLLEDTTVTDEYLRACGFSWRVVDGIHAMSKTKGQAYDDYLEQVLSNDDAVLVKMSDLRDNSRIDRMVGTTDRDLRRITKYFKAYEILQNAAIERGLI